MSIKGIKGGVYMISVLLCDDHTVVRTGLKSLLNNHSKIKVIGEAAEGDEAIAKAAKLQPDIILMDLSMPQGKDGMTATKEIKEKFPHIEILILTMHEDEEYLYRALEAGASGVLLKSAPHHELIEAIYALHQGDAYLFPKAVKRLLEDYLAQDGGERSDSFHQLSNREREVLTLIARGYSNKEIGEKLFISVKTVETHRRNLMTKLEMRTRPELVNLALKKGLIGYGI